MEQRRYPRAEVSIMADYMSPHMMTFDYLKDLSLGGAFLYSDTVDTVGTPATLIFHLPNRSASISAKAEVVWVRTSGSESSLSEPGMGIRFCDLKGEDNEALAEFLRSLRADDL